MVNGENSAVGNGILPMSADDIFTSGADVVNPLATTPSDVVKYMTSLRETSFF